MLIKPMANRNGLTFAVIAGLLVILSLFALLTSTNSSINIVSAVALMLGFCLAIIAFGKLRDVNYRFSLTQDGIHYFTYRGGFTLLWQDIQRIDVPTVQQSLERTGLPYIGIRLNNYERFIHTASLPVLAHMLIDQRALTLMIENTQSHFGRGDNMLFPDNKNTADHVHKRTVTGLRAMFIDRMQFLHDNLGYDIYFPVDDLDRDPLLFVQLLRNFRKNIIIDQIEQE